MKILSIVNQKGGVGKTTTTINLGAALAAMGQRVCLVDLDSQRNLSRTLQVESADKHSVSDLIYNHVSEIRYDPSSYLLHNDKEGLDYIQSSTMLSTAPTILATSDNSNMVLSEILHAPTFTDGYDYILIDCHPALDLLTVNAMAASDAVIVPVEPESYAVDALGDLWATIERTKKVQPLLHVGGIVITRADSRRNLTRQMTSDLRETFSNLVYQTIIPYLADAPKAASACCSAVSMKDNRIGEAYRNLAEEVLVQ